MFGFGVGGSGLFIQVVFDLIKYCLGERVVIGLWRERGRVGEGTMN